MSSRQSGHRFSLRRLETYELLTRVLRHLSVRRRRHLLLLIFLIVFSAFAEVVSLGAVLPFLGVLTAPEKVLGYPIVADVARFFGMTSPGDLVLPFTVGFAVAALAAGSIRLLLLWVSMRVACGVNADLSVEAYRRTLYQPYQVHVARSSSTVISGISKVANIQMFLSALLTLGSSAVLIFAIGVTLLVIDAVVATVAALCFGVSYLLITWRSRDRLIRNGTLMSQENTQVLKALQEGLGGIRDVLLDGTQPLYCDIYRRSQLRLVRANGNNMVIGTSPRYVMESLGIVLIAALAYGLSRQAGGLAQALPALGALAIAAQRLLPALQQVYGSWVNIVACRPSVADALELLDQRVSSELDGPAPAPLVLREAIRFESVSFRYATSDGSWALADLNLTIPKGARVGLVGSTGSGKSTALDLVMGLLEPVKGQIVVDGHPITGACRRAWQRTIAHVPQSIFLADATVAENIAFGVPREQIDLERVRQAAHQAQIGEFLESRPDGYQALVGEHGVRLSGGQRQRIGIARALYKQATVLVFDEATSALDNATEHAVMDAIENLNRELTVLIIAHRLTTVQNCDTIVHLESGRITAQGTYDELLEHSPSFRKMAGVADNPRPTSLECTSDHR